MIEALHIEGIAVVESAQLEFGPGLNVLTGETGAGKSVVLGALSLLSGARAGAGILREGSDHATVEAVFATERLPELQAELADAGFGAIDDEGELVVSRSIARSGRGRARVMGQLVPVSVLAKLFEGRIEISSQHSSQALLRPEMHGWFLDAAAGLLELRAEVAEGHASLRALDTEIADLRAESEERERRRDFLGFQLAEIDEVDLQPGELVSLSRDHSLFANADRLRAEGSGAVTALLGDTQGGDAAGAADLVATALRELEALAGIDPALGSLVERLRGLDAELRDTAADLERFVDGIDADPGRLAQLEERVAEIERLRRKYGQGEEEIFAHRAQVADQLASVDGAEERIEALVSRRASQRDALAKAAGRLSAGRRKAGRKLGRTLEAGLADLAMANARIEVALRPLAEGGDASGLPCGPTGAESPEFRFSANAGEEPRALRKVASGGELSRVFLALKNALRGAASGMVLVFDEVDAGVGGRVAERIGRALADLAREHQVLCITHLPQIAAFADVHFRVEKSEEGGRTLARIERLEGDARVDEIARMAGGESVTEVTRAHARDLLKARPPS